MQKHKGIRRSLYLIGFSAICLVFPLQAQNVSHYTLETCQNLLALDTGNSWTYLHTYRNDLVSGGYLKTGHEYHYDPVPGYDPSDPSILPPDSLLRTSRILTVSVVDTLTIDDRIYFEISGAPYEWPPLPNNFIAGKSIRCDDSGRLLYRHADVDSALFDFNRSAIGGIEAQDIHLGEQPAYGNDATGTVDIRNSFFVLSRTGHVADGFVSNQFLPGYGIAYADVVVLAPSFALQAAFENYLSPLGAALSGHSTTYEEAGGRSRSPARFTAVLPSSWGALKKQVCRSAR